MVSWQIFAQGSNYTMIVAFGLMFALFYVLIILPERRKGAELNRMLAALKKNDRVITKGGILATVVNVSKDSEEVTIRVDEGNNTRLRILRSAILQVVVDQADEASRAKEKDKKEA